MKKVLHIITRKDDDMARTCVLQGGAQTRGSQNTDSSPEHKAAVFDLTQPAPDYTALAHAIFEADTVAVW